MHHDIVCKITGAGARREFSILPPPPTLHPIFRSVVGFLILFARSVSGRRSRSVSTKRNEFDYVDSSGFVWYPDTRLLELTIPWTSLWRLNLSRRRRRVRRSATRALVLGGNDCSLVGSWSLYSGPIWSAVSSYSISIDFRHCRTSRINRGINLDLFTLYVVRFEKIVRFWTSVCSSVVSVLGRDDSALHVRISRYTDLIGFIYSTRREIHHTKWR